MIKLKKIFEDDDILVIDKPAGLRVDTDPSGKESVESILNFPIERHGIVHRIDKETSGILLVAKNNESLEKLKTQFQNHTTNKIYTTLILGNVDKPGEIISFLARDPKRKQAMKVIDYPTGQERGTLREAITNYKPLKHYMIGSIELTLLEVKILTGRTHQIRVHMQSIGHPIIGDDMYQSKTSRQASEMLGLNRQFLHASYLEIIHPKTNQIVFFTSNLPDDLENILGQITSTN